MGDDKRLRVNDQYEERMIIIEGKLKHIAELLDWHKVKSSDPRRHSGHVNELDYVLAELSDLELYLGWAEMNDE